MASKKKTFIAILCMFSVQRLTGIKCNDVQLATHAGDCLFERETGAVCIKLADGGCVLVAKE